MIKGSTANAWRSNEGGTPMRKICWRLSAQSLFFQLFFARLQSSAPADCHCALEVFRGSMFNPWRTTDEGTPMRKNCWRLSAQSPLFQLSFARLQSSAPADRHCALENFRGSVFNAWRPTGEGAPMRKNCRRLSAHSPLFQLSFARLQFSAPADRHCALENCRGSVFNVWRATGEGTPMRKNCRRLSAQSQFFQLSFARLQSSAPADCHCALENFRNQFSTPGGQLAKALLCARFEIRFRSFSNSSRWPSTAVRALCHHAAASAHTHRKRPSSN